MSVLPLSRTWIPLMYGKSLWQFQQWWSTVAQPCICGSGPWSSYSACPSRHSCYYEHMGQGKMPAVCSHDGNRIKLSMQARFWQSMDLRLYVVHAEHGGTSNNGNTARKFFKEDPENTTKILDIDVKNCEPVCQAAGHVQQSRDKTIMCWVREECKGAVWPVDIPNSRQVPSQPECAQVSVPWSSVPLPFWDAHWSSLRKCSGGQK